MEKRTFKNKVYTELAKLSKAMANPHRMEIIDLLAQGPFSVEQIATHTEMSVANASQHLQVLKSARLVDAYKKGNFVYYHLSSEKVFDTWRSLRELGMREMAEVEKLMHDFRYSRYKLESITAEELLIKLQQHEAVVLDVRPEEEYQHGHIPNAISMPIDQLTERLHELPSDKEIIAYCRGPFCVFADEAVALLQQKGFNARRLQEGFPDWSVKGLPTNI